MYVVYWEKMAGQHVRCLLSSPASCFRFVLLVQCSFPFFHYLRRVYSRPSPLPLTPLSLPFPASIVSMYSIGLYSVMICCYSERLVRNRKSSLSPSYLTVSLLILYPLLPSPCNGSCYLSRPDSKPSTR